MIVTSCSRTALSLVAADAMLSMSFLKDSMKLSAGIAPGGGTWVTPLIVDGCTPSPLCAIPWICEAAFADPKESAEGLELHMTRLRASCASWKWDFHFSQVRSSCSNPSNLGCSSGKVFSESRDRDATATSHASNIARPACLAFRCASSQWVINSGTHGSSTHQDNIPCWSPITSIA